jgi:plastocyanin
VSYRIAGLVALVAAGALLVPGAAVSGARQQNRLIGAVGPGFTITLSTESGQPVKQLEAGSYTIEVQDRSAIHNFHLVGPGVDRRTEVDFVGTETWQITVQSGAYTYVCDPHAAAMRGSFAVGGAKSPSPAPSSKRKTKKLTGSVGPGFTISLRSSGGRSVKKMTAGTYRITVRDRSSSHNFHLRGPGINKATAVAFRGTVTWSVRLKKGMYRFVCDPHRQTMRGSFRVT